MHPLYHHCLRCVNRPVTVHLKDGRSHYGTIHRVTPGGIYFSPLARPVSTDLNEKLEVSHSDQPNASDSALEPVFFAPLFFGFGLLAGVALGAAAGWGWGWGGYGYGGYGWW